jgi:pimeloyl-ACP methyl ester carboxylesterase
VPSITSDAGSTPVDLHVEDTGGEGRPVVLIHGWPLSGESWKSQVPALSEAGYRVVSYDRRGFGRSGKPEDGYDYDTFAGDLDAVLTGLDLRDATLVGFSMGGGEVARYVGRQGTGRLRSVAFLGAVPPYLFKSDDNPDGGVEEELVQGMQGGIREDRAGFFDQFAKGFYSAGDDLKVDESELAEFQRMQQPARDEAVLACIDAFARTDFRDDLTKVDVPALVVHGDSDAIVPFEVSGKRTAETLRATPVVIEQGPHGITASHTDEVNRVLLDFLAAH